MLEKISAREVVDAFTVVHPTPRVMRIQNRAWYGISLALEGELIYRLDGKSYVSDADHIIVLPMNASYTLECTVPGKFLLINFMPTSEFELNTFLRIPCKDKSAVISGFSKIQAALASTSVSKAPRSLSCFYELIARIIDSGIPKTASPIIDKATKYISRNAHLPTLSNAEIADAVGISEVYLRKLFTKNLGQSPKSYIQSVRINLARSYLIESSISITEIAERCGYSDLYIFCHAFKRITGYTPKEYRTSMRSL